MILTTTLCAGSLAEAHMPDEDVDPPARSDLPEYDFEDAKPKDFE